MCSMYIGVTNFDIFALSISYRQLWPCTFCVNRQQYFSCTRQCVVIPFSVWTIHEPCLEICRHVEGVDSSWPRGPSEKERWVGGRKRREFLRSPTVVTSAFAKCLKLVLIEISIVDPSHFFVVVIVVGGADHYQRSKVRSKGRGRVKWKQIAIYILTPVRVWRKAPQKCSDSKSVSCCSLVQT